MSEQINLRWKYPGLKKSARLLGIQDTTIYRTGLLKELGVIKEQGKVSIPILDSAIEDLKSSIQSMNDLLEDLKFARDHAIEEAEAILSEPEITPESSFRKILDEFVRPLFPGKELYRTCHEMHRGDPDEAFQTFIHEIDIRSDGKIPPGMFPKDVLWNWAIDAGEVW